MGCFGEGGVPIKITGLLFRGRCCTSFFSQKAPNLRVQELLEVIVAVSLIQLAEDRLFVSPACHYWEPKFSRGPKILKQMAKSIRETYSVDLPSR
jgi:hypothetical protein